LGGHILNKIETNVLPEENISRKVVVSPTCIYYSIKRRLKWFEKENGFHVGELMVTAAVLSSSGVEQTKITSMGADNYTDHRKCVGRKAAPRLKFSIRAVVDEYRMSTALCPK
jgi:hypothetical protein